jgi:hypothetical protein
VAAWLNWRGSRVGYWSSLNLTDIGFVAAIVLPGYITVGNAHPDERIPNANNAVTNAVLEHLAAGAPGPILWLLAAVFTTIGRLTDDRRSTNAATGQPR